MRIAVTSAPNFGIKFGWRWLRHRRVSPLGLLAMTTVFCHSEEQSDVGIRPFYDFTMDGGRGFGPPYLGHGLRRPNFVPKFGASVKSSAPTEGLPKSQQRADVGIGPYGKPNQPPKPAGAQRSVRARVGEGWAGIDARIIPKGGPPLRLPGQRLAKRKARKEKLVKFGLCPMISECSTAYHVRKSQHSSARAPVGAAVTEQNSLEPRPAARQGASRARNCAAISVFFF